MTVVKVIEVQAKSAESWEAAANEAIKQAAKTVRNIRAIQINEFRATVEGNRIVEYSIDAKITFDIEGS